MFKALTNEKGSVLVVALMMLAFLALLGAAVIATTGIEIQISGNEKFQRTAFFSAEAARSYVPPNHELYGIDNISVGQGISFPNEANPSERLSISDTQSFNGHVEYIGSAPPPRGSGYQVGKFKAHQYKMICNGFGPASAQAQVEAGFYRIGF